MHAAVRLSLAHSAQGCCSRRQHVLFPGSFGSSHGSRPTGREVVSRCGLDVRLPDD